MASIERRRDGYRVRWRDPDGTARSHQCPSKPIAIQIARKVEAASALGERWDPPAPVAVPALDDLIHAYLLSLGRLSRPATVKAHRSQLQGVFLGWCHKQGATKASDLSRSLVEAFDAERAKQGLSVGTRRVTLTIIGAWWRWCCEHETFRAHVPPHVRVKKPAREVHAAVAPLWVEVDAVVELAMSDAVDTAAGSIDQSIYRVATLMRGTGLRVWQACRLRYEDFDFRLGTLWIRPELGKTAPERSGRRLPLPAWLIAEVLRWSRMDDRTAGVVAAMRSHRRVGIEDGTLVEPYPETAAARIGKLWRRARVDGEPVRPEVYVRQPDHAFRKAIQTEMEFARCRERAIEYWLGRDIGVAGHYTDPRAHDLLEIARHIPKPPCVPAVSLAPGEKAPSWLARLA